jgi:hypothetical protein
MQEVLQHLGVNKTRTIPLHPQSDVTVERFIMVEEHLWKLVAMHHRDWDTTLSIFLLAYRASNLNTTDLTPG